MTITVPLDGAADALRQQISGQVLTANEAAYEDLRLAWNRAHEHNPALIVVPGSAADVATAVRHAVDHGLAVAVQATGHGVARPAQGSMLILTHALDWVDVDAAARTARFGAGVKWERVLGPATEHGLAPLVGSTPDVSAVGYTLGGGVGWLSNRYGLSSDAVRSIEIVTADGEIRRATPDSEPDLFWALRGGGAGSFGVVTEMEIDLMPVPSLYAGNLLYPASMAREVAARYREWITSTPDELTSSIVFMNFPPFEDVPEIIRGKSFTIIRGAFTGSDTAGAELMRFWREWQAPALDMWGRIPFSQVATISNDPVDPMMGAVSTEWLASLDADTVDILVEAMFEQNGPSPLIVAEVRNIGGAVARTPIYPSAYGNRSQQHLLELIGAGMDEASIRAVEAFIGTTREKLAPHLAGGAYLNFLEGAEKTARSSEGFEPDSWKRLRQIKATYDPANLFSHGVAIA